MPAPWRGLTHNQRVIQVFDYTRHTIRPGSVLTTDKNPLVPPSAAFSPNPQRLGPDAGTVGVGKSLGSVVQKDITRESVPPAVRLRTAAMIDLLRTFRIFMSKPGQTRVSCAFFNVHSFGGVPGQDVAICKCVQLTRQSRPRTRNRVRFITDCGKVIMTC